MVGWGYICGDVTDDQLSVWAHKNIKFHVFEFPHFVLQNDKPSFHDGCKRLPLELRSHQTCDRRLRTHV